MSLVFRRNESMLLTSRLKTGDGMTVTSRELEKAYHTDSYTSCDMPGFLCLIL